MKTVRHRFTVCGRHWAQAERTESEHVAVLQWGFCLPFLILTSCATQSEHEALDEFCSLSQTVPAELKRQMFGWSGWLLERVTNEEIVEELRVTLQMDDSEERTSHLRALVRRHGITECSEIDVLEEIDRRRAREAEALRDSFETSDAPN